MKGAEHVNVQLTAITGGGRGGAARQITARANRIRRAGR